MVTLATRSVGSPVQLGYDASPTMQPIWLAILMLLVLPLVLSAQPTIFASGVDVVHVGVWFVGADGQPIQDLTRSDIELYEDGKRQEIQYFSRGMRSDRETMPLRVGLLFDVSESMTKEAHFAKTAAIRILSTLNYARDMTLVDFDGEVRLGRFTQADFPRLVERIRSRESTGWTAFYDALGLYLDSAFEQKGRKVLLMYSDGEDTRSRQQFSDTVDLVRASDVTVYAISFQEQPITSERMLLRARLEELATVSGGRCFFLSDVRELDAIYAEIAGELDNRYSLGYVSTNAKLDGTWRQVEVKLRGERDSSKDIRIRSREGYYARYPQSPAGERENPDSRIVR